MQNLNPTLEQWKELSGKTFKCHTGLGNFEKKSVELSFEYNPAKEPESQLRLCFKNPDASLEVLGQIGENVQEVYWNRWDPVFFDPINMVALLELQNREAYYLIQGMATFWDIWMDMMENDIWAEPDPKMQHPVGLLRIRFNQTGPNTQLLDQWMKAIGWDGQPGDPAKSFKAFPNDVPRPPEPFPRILMKVEGGTAFGRYYKAGAFTDFILASDDGQELKVHRIVIAAACEVFHNMLTHETKEKQNGLCRIGNIDFETLELLVDVLYGFPVEESRLKIHCKNLYVAADMYQLLELKMKCATYLGESMELENIVDLLKFAKDNEIEGLPEKIVRFVAQRFSEFLDSDGVNKVAEKIPEHSSDFIRQVVDLRMLG